MAHNKKTVCNGNKVCECAKCVHVSTKQGNQCYTLTRRLNELVKRKGNPFYPKFVIPALDKIANECKRYKEM